MVLVESVTDSIIDFGGGLVGMDRPGPGDAILWVHGYTLDSTSWVDLWDLLPGWHHIGVDLPGHGGSRALGARDDLRSVARGLTELALAHEVQHVAALSFGTIIAAQMAIERPTAFRTLTLGATSLAGARQDPDVERMYAELTDLYRERGPGAHLRALWMSSPPPLFAGASNQPALWNRLWEIVGRHGFEELESGAMQRLTGRAQREEDLRKIRAATLVLLGEQELLAFRRCGEVVRRAVPHCERHYLPDVGHLCLLEAPRQVCGLIDAHLRRHAVCLP